MIQTINRKTNRFWVCGGKVSTMTITQCNHIYTYIKMQSEFQHSKKWKNMSFHRCMEQLIRWFWKDNTMPTPILHYLSLLQSSKMQFVTLSPTEYRKNTIFNESADKGKKRVPGKHTTPQITVTCAWNSFHFFHVFLYKPGLSYRPDHDDHNNMITAQDIGVINLLP